jgi:hypothetical protein
MLRAPILEQRTAIRRQFTERKNDNEITNRRHLRIQWRRICPAPGGRGGLFALREIVLEDRTAVYVSAERNVALTLDGCSKTLPSQLLVRSVENVDLSVPAPSEAQRRPGPVDRYARNSNHDAPPSYSME